jgi:hypothetical protein
MLNKTFTNNLDDKMRHAHDLYVCSNMVAEYYDANNRGDLAAFYRKESKKYLFKRNMMRVCIKIKNEISSLA